MKKNNQDPTVSVIIPVYNGATYLSETLDLILAQTYSSFEIILVDDESTDRSQEIIKQYKQKYPGKIHYIWQKHAGAPAIGRNKAIRNSRGYYIAFCDQDDLWLTTKLEKQVIALKQNPDAKACFTNAYVFDDKFKEVNKVWWQGQLNLPDRQKEQFKFLLEGGDKFASCGAIVRKEIFDILGLLDENLVGVDDYDMWLRITQKYQIMVLDEPLACWRARSLSLSSFNEEMLNKTAAIYNKLISSNNLQDDFKNIAYSEKSRILFQLANCALVFREYQKARKYYKELKKYQPISAKKKTAIFLSKVWPSFLRFLYLAKKKIINSDNNRITILGPQYFREQV